MVERKFSLGLLIIIFLMTGCASGVSRTKVNSKEPFVCSANNPIGNIELTLTQEGKAALTDNLKFDPEELKDHVERALYASSLLDTNGKANLLTLMVEVKDIRVRSNFSAVMWGFMAGDDHIVGDIVVKATDGLEMDRFEVSSSYALGGFAGGQDSSRMGWLYEAFAEETIKELTKNNIKRNSAEEPLPGVKLQPIDQPLLEDINDSRVEQVYKIGDVVLLGFKNGNTQKITITHIDDRFVVGTYEYTIGHTTGVSYDQRDIKNIEYFK
jgi:hypothetical protein